MLNLTPKPKLLVLVGVISAMALISLYTFAAMTAQNQFQSKQSSEVEPTPLPTVDYRAKEPTSVGEVNIRRARSSRHDQSPINVKELPPDIDQLPIISHFWWGLPSIPTEQSDAIIVGEVTNAQAYLSNDKTGVYSEFIIQVEQILKAPEGLNPTSIMVERTGGAVRFPSGRIVRYEVHNQGMPRVGRRYLLFLRYNNEGDDFSVLTGYAFRNGRVVPLDSVEGLFTQYNDWSEAAFHNLVTTTINGRATVK
jgi:hypothetical protein